MWKMRDFFKSCFVLPLSLALMSGCGGTRIFMGSYDYVKIAVSQDQAVMSAENFSGIGVQGCFQEKDVAPCGEKMIDGDVYVYLESSDAGLMDNVTCVAVDLGKPKGNYSIISEVIIYPSQKSSTEPGKWYHEILFKTKDGLDIGSHSILVKDPLAFTLCRGAMNSGKSIEMHITNSESIQCDKLVIKDKESIFPATIELQILSQIISSARKPIRVIFVKA